MDLRKALAKHKISQRELGRRLGYDSNGAVSGVLSGRMRIPMDDIPRWADALQLEGQERADFVDWASKDALPDWAIAQVNALKNAISDLEAHVKECQRRELVASAALTFIVEAGHFYPSHKAIGEKLEEIMENPRVITEVDVHALLRPVFSRPRVRRETQEADQSEPPARKAHAGHTPAGS